MFDFGKMAVFISILAPIVTGIIGYFSLRYKASAAYVDSLQSRLDDMAETERRCRESVAELSAKIDTYHSDLLKVKAELYEKEVELIRLRKASNERLMDDVQGNTKLTEKTLEAVEKLTAKIDQTQGEKP